MLPLQRLQGERNGLVYVLDCPACQNRQITMANDRGYIIIQRGMPPAELFKAVKVFVGEKKFQDLRMTTSNTGSLRVDGGKACEELLSYGINVSTDIVYQQFETNL